MGQQNERTLRCTTVLQLLLLNHTDVILKQGTTRYASLLQQYRASDTLASNVEKTTTGRRKSSPKYFAKEKLGKYYPLSQQTTLRPLTRRQKQDANKTLRDEGKNTFKDYAYQVALTHVEYVDRATRGANPIPPFDYQNDKTLKKLKTFWLGYSDVKTKVLQLWWIENAVIDNVDNVCIWSQTWVAYQKKGSAT